MVVLHHGNEVPRPWPSCEPTAVDIVDGAVVIQYGEHERRLPAIWARDNCPCPHCRIAQTGEHRYFLGAVADPPTVAATELRGAAVVIRFVDGHEASFEPTDFARLLHQAGRGHQPIATWDGSASLPEFDHGAVVDDPAVQLELCEVFLRFGALRVTAMPTTSEEVLRFLAALGVPPRNTPFGLVHDVLVDPDGYNVAHTAEPLPPHNDFASYRYPPSGQLLHMLVNDATGGETLVVDGFEIVEQLRAIDADLVAVLARVPVAHRQWSADVETWAREPLLRTNSSGDVIGVRFSNQLLQPLDPEHADTDAWYTAYHALARLIADPANQVAFRLDAGQMLMVDGHRIMHARTGFDASSGGRRLQDAYFFADDIRGRAAVLSGNRCVVA